MRIVLGLKRKYETKNLIKPTDTVLVIKNDVNMKSIFMS